MVFDARHNQRHSRLCTAEFRITKRLSKASFSKTESTANASHESRSEDLSSGFKMNKRRRKF